MAIVLDIKTGPIDFIAEGDRFVVPEGQMLVYSHILVEGELIIDENGHLLLIP